MSSNLPDSESFSAEHFEAVGRLVIACSDLESKLTELCAVITETNMIAAIAMIGHQQFSSKVDTIKAYMDFVLKDAAKASDTFRILDAAKTAYDLRNTVVHAIWISDDDGSPVAVRFTARGRFVRSRRQISTQALLDNAEKARTCARDLIQIADRIRAARRLSG